MPRVLLSAAAEFQWGQSSGEEPRMSRVSQDDPRALVTSGYRAGCVTPPLVASGEPCHLGLGVSVVDICLQRYLWKGQLKIY